MNTRFKTTVTLGTLSFLVITVLFANVNSANAQSAGLAPNAVTQNQSVDKKKSAADKQLDLRIENLTKLKARVQQFKNLGDNDLSGILTVIDNVIVNFSNLKGYIENATSTDSIQQAREALSKDYRVYVLIMPQLNIIAASDRMTTTVSMLNIVATKLENRLNNVATSTDITSTNLASAKKALVELKTALAQAQTDAQAAVTLVAPLLPDQGDKDVAETNQKAIKDARAKIKSAHAGIVLAKKNSDDIVKMLGREKKNDQKPATSPGTN